ncbi:MAG TPA: bacillithiol transferase BstA [Terriglobales bacterium]
MNDPLNDPRYPIGRFSADLNSTPETRARHVADIAGLPVRLRQAVAGLSADQLDTPYRDGGWTVRQVVHHVPDSHLNAYIRCKLTLTEETPSIKPYDENAWARLKDSALTPVEVSLALLDAVHSRWVTLLRSLQSGDFERRFNHPEAGVHDLDWLVALYDWHGNHHLSHITTLRQRMKW